MMSNEILKVIQENQGLPVYAYVNGEVVGDNYASCEWLGKITSAEVRTIAFTDEPYGYYDQTLVDKSDCEEYIQYLLDYHEDWDEYGNEEAEKLAYNEMEKLEFKEVILLHVNTFNGGV